MESDDRKEAPDRIALLKQLGDDRIMAHQALFKHRHPDATPPFHKEIIDIWHAADPQALVMVFREGGKSTIAEEAFVVGAGFQLFHNAIIIGSTEKRACERLRAIKHELEFNEMVQGLFGNLVGPVWNEAEVVLSNGVRIIAVGRGQSLRGTKHLHWRPDFCFMDDVEEEENVKDPEARAETLSWFMSVVKPALDVNARIRVNATPLDREALPYRLQHELKWPTRIYPIEFLDAEGSRRATWPSRYPLSWIDKTKQDFEATGRLTEYMREYMCIAEDPERKIFKSEYFKVEPHVLTWQPVFAFIDPARTVKASSSTTGWCVWSYGQKRRIWVWDGGGNFWRPDEIINKIFEIDSQFRPVAIGVERDGLEEFLLQPLRHEALQRRIVLPLVPMRAPRGKEDFIAGLQPHFKAGEIVFAKELPELRAQFLSYPSGKLDGPNALAYAQLMAPNPVFTNFGFDHVVDSFVPLDRYPAWICLNSRHGFVTGILVQLVKERVRVLADWVEEGDVGQVAGIIKGAAAILGGRGAAPVLVAPPSHFGAYDHLGLRAAVSKVPALLTKGSEIDRGRSEVRELLSRRSDDVPGLQISLAARNTVNAFAAGFSYEIGRDGAMREEPRDGMYRCLIEGLESFTGILSSGSLAADRPNYQFTESGHRFISALPTKGPLHAKDEFPPDNNEVRFSARTLLRR